VLVALVVHQSVAARAGVAVATTAAAANAAAARNDKNRRLRFPLLGAFSTFADRKPDSSL